MGLKQFLSKFLGLANVIVEGVEWDVSWPSKQLVVKVRPSWPMQLVRRAGTPPSWAWRKGETTVWPEETGPLPPKRHRGRGRPPSRLRRGRGHQPVSVRELAIALRPSRFRAITWREGTAAPDGFDLPELSVEISPREEPTAEIAAWASMIEESSGDPVFLPAMR